MSDEVKLRAAAVELRNYILLRGGRPINASHDYDVFLRHYASREFVYIMNNPKTKPKALAQMFPDLLRWQDGPPTNLICAMSTTEAFTTSDDGLVERVIGMRSQYIRKNILDRLEVDEAEFKWGFNFLARHTIRLFGISATSDTHFLALRDRIMDLITEIQPNSEAEVFVFLYKNPEKSNMALCYFTLVHPTDTDAADLLFNSLLDDNAAITQGRLRVNGETITPDRIRLPWAPHDAALAFIPSMVAARRSQWARINAPAGDATTSATTTATTSDGSDEPDDLPPLTPSSSTERSPGKPTTTATTATTNTAQPLFVMDDSTILFPDNYGHLEDGMASAVVSPAKLSMESQRQRDKFDRLKSIVSGSANGVFCHVAKEGCFVFYKHKDFLLGEGSEAKVYLGGFLRGEYPEDVRLSVISPDFVDRAKPVAIKQYRSSNAHGEINTLQALPRGVDGIINYLESFELHDDLYVAQELGLVNLAHEIVQRATLQERLCIVRAACLAVQQLHKRTKGGVVHRDIRTPNFLLTDDGRLKICDFGISRVLPDSMQTMQTKGGALAHLSFQPYEVQMKIEEIFRKREELSKRTGSFEVEEDGMDATIPISLRSDIFMLGLVIYKVMTNREAMTNADIMRRQAPDLSAITSLFTGGHLLAHLLTLMLSHEPDKRPTIGQVLDHPFFKTGHEHHQFIVQIFQVIHDSPIVHETEKFKLLEEILTPLEREINWSTLRDKLPDGLRNTIHQSASPPRVCSLPPESIDRDHPLPNLHGAVQWLRHFFTHFGDSRNLERCGCDLKARIKDGEALAEAIHALDSINWILPKLWEMCVRFQHRELQAKLAWAAEWERLQKENEEKINGFKTQERKIKVLFGVSG